MNIYTYEGLVELARSKKIPVCAWTPKNPPLAPPQDDPCRVWIHDIHGNAKTYLQELNPYAEKWVIHPPKEINQRKENKMGTFELINGYDRKKVPEKRLFRAITFEEAKKLYAGQNVKISVDGKVWRNIKINGKVQTWKRNPNRIGIPCKYGMYECFKLNQSDFDQIVVEVEKEV